MKKLQDQFSIKDLGSLNYCLGIEVSNTASGLHLSQTRYLLSILERVSMSLAKPCQTPMQTGVLISKFTGNTMDDSQLDRYVVRALQYATITKPDLTFTVNKLSQFMAAPTDMHWHLVKRILKYI
jgi:Reverse transcriptase (RNA-dependent DNA polymerase)